MAGLLKRLLPQHDQQRNQNNENETYKIAILQIFKESTVWFETKKADPAGKIRTGQG